MSRDPGSARLVELEGCLNFRDMGGYGTRSGRRVRWGVLYRSDALHHMTPEDVCRVRDGLGVRAVVDLRSSAEIANDGIGPLPAPPVSYHHVPLFDGGSSDLEPEEIPMDLGHQYFLLLRIAWEAIHHTVEVITHSSAPAIFHCAAGKDRTGLVAAVLLGLLDVEDKHIVEDYVLTSRVLDSIIERLERSTSYQKVFEHLPPDTFHAEPESMHSFLRRVREAHGSLREFALEGGLSPGTLERLEERLLEEA